MSDENLYAYGVIRDESLDLPVDGVCGASRVYTVSYRTLAAVVSDIGTMEPERTDENVEAHDETLREVMMHGDGRTVVPMQFGMTFKNARPLKSVLRGGQRAFRKALNEIDDRVELGIKLVVDEDAVVDADALREQAHSELEAASIDYTEDDLYSERLVMNRSYLVDRDEQDAFNDAIDRVEERMDDRAMVRYTGPWAPYSFVDIHIGAEGQR